MKNIAPEAVQALAEDKDVGRVDGLKRTLDLMARRVPVITKAALWWAPRAHLWLCRRYLPHVLALQDLPTPEARKR